MAQAAFDNNGVPTILGTSNADGSTPVRIKVDATSHALITDDNTTGSDLSDDIAGRDANGRTVLMGLSSVDGVTPVEIYADPATGALLINSV